MVNFNEILNTKSGSIERPPIIPMGTYRAVVTKIPAIDTTGDGKWDTCDFQMKLLSAEEDVDQDDLKAYGGLGPQSVIRHNFMFNKEDEANFKRTLFNLKRFLLEHLQVEGNDDTSLKELLDASVNHQCLVFVNWRADKNDPEIQYAQVRKTAPVS
jgi:hypothetical protein